MSRQGPETRLVNHIKKAIEAKYPDALVIKIHGGPYQQAGVSDLLACVQGQFVSLEVKVDCHKYGVTPLQAEFIRKVWEAGGVAGTVETPEQALGLIDQAVRNSDCRVPSTGSGMDVHD